MLTLKDLDYDQHCAIDHCFENDATFLIAGMGAGKTIIALTAAEELLMSAVVQRVLVFAPLKVCNSVWRKEHTLWEHTQHLKVQIMTGDERELDLSADIVVVNFDLMQWFADQDWYSLFDGLVIDESSKLAAGGKWFKSLRHQVKNFTWRLIMNGTPVSEGWHKAFYQMFLVDAGKTFGRNKQKWLEKYFYPTDFKRYNWAVKPGQEPRLAKMIEPFTHVVPDYRDSLPPLTIEHVTTPLPLDARAHYKAMAGSMETAGVLAQNAAVKSMKLTQIANGFVYDKDKKAIRIHDAKNEILVSLFEKIRKSVVTNILIIYQFIEELDQLREQYPTLRVLKTAADVDDWNAGRLNIMAMHPKSGGHGLNMAQGGCNLVWLSPPWSRDLLDQTNARLWRRGQRHPVTAFILVAEDTIDELILARLETKGAFLPEFLRHLAEQAA